MDAWRILLGTHAIDGRTAYSGEGARRSGGRWNSRGVAVAYASSSLALSALECLVHAEERFLRAAALLSVQASWPDDLQVESAPPSAYLPGWRDHPAPPELAAFGDRWVAERRTAVLLVRSALIPSELNVLVNPAHPQFAQLTFGPPEPFVFDPRLLPRS